jgi:putative acetyltransferase
MLVRDFCQSDRDGIDKLLCAAFGGTAEASLVVDLRHSRCVLAELVAGLSDADHPMTMIVGHVLFSRVVIHVNARQIPAVSLAPLAVSESYRRQGIGAELVGRGLSQLRSTGERIVFVLGEPAYYGRFGFSAAAAAGFECIYSCDAFQSLDLDPTAAPITSGRVVYAPPFALL